MPSYKDLLTLLAEGKSPHEVVRKLKMRPSHWRRMLSGKRFQDALISEENLASIMACHDISVGVHTAAERFTELLDSDKPETVRKAALALLREGLRGGRAKKSQQAPIKPDRQVPPQATGDANTDTESD